MLDKQCGLGPAAHRQPLRACKLGWDRLFFFFLSILLLLLSSRAWGLPLDRTGDLSSQTRD